MVKKKTQTLELEVNQILAETLVQCLRYPSREVISAVKENLPGIDDSAICEVTEKLEEEVVDQITWGQF